MHLGASFKIARYFITSILVVLHSVRVLLSGQNCCDSQHEVTPNTKIQGRILGLFRNFRYVSHRLQVFKA